MARRTVTSARQVSQVELAELLPLLNGVHKAMARRAQEVPLAIKSVWHERGLAPRHMAVLISLALTGPMSVSELSNRLGVGLATTSLLVSELGRAGLVVRSEDETDRRRTIVDLVPQQRQAVSTFVSRRAALIKSAIEEIEPEERAGLMKGLRLIVAALESTPIDTSTEEPRPVRARR